MWWDVVVTEWAGLRDAYGDAGVVPGLLAAAAHETAWESEVWEDLWSRLYHQGSIYPASTAALPLLVEIAIGRPGVAVDPALFLATSILSRSGGAEGQEYYGGLVDLATAKLALVEDRVDVLYALQCVAGVEGLTAWFGPLEGLAGGEVEVECSHCGDHVYIEVHDGGMLSTEFSDDSHGRQVTPASADDLGPGAARLLSLARQHGHEAVSVELLTLFGQVSCPVCGASFHIDD